MYADDGVMVDAMMRIINKILFLSNRGVVGYSGGRFGCCCVHVVRSRTTTTTIIIIVASHQMDEAARSYTCTHTHYQCNMCGKNVIADKKVYLNQTPSPQYHYYHHRRQTTTKPSSSAEAAAIKVKMHDYE